MVTVSEFLVKKLLTFNIQVDTAELAVSLEKRGLMEDAIYNLQTDALVKQVIVDLVPALLMLPDITEGGYSIKWDKAGIKAYYSYLCRELGVDDVFETSREDEVRNRSDIW